MALISIRLGAVDIYLSEGDYLKFFVLTRCGEEKQTIYFDKPQRRQRGKGL